MKLTYLTYSFLIRGKPETSRATGRVITNSFWVDVVACDADAARADIDCAFFNAEIITWGAR